MFQASTGSTKRANPVLRLRSQGAAARTLCYDIGRRRRGQAAVDPNVAPRAAALERARERREAIECWATTLPPPPTDACERWFSSAVYTAQCADWNSRATGDPGWPSHLDFAATAVRPGGPAFSRLRHSLLGDGRHGTVGFFLEDQVGHRCRGIGSVRTPSDAHRSFSSWVRISWPHARRWRALVGTDLEALSVWYDNGNLRSVGSCRSGPAVCHDSLYRRRWRAMETDPRIPDPQCLGRCGAPRALCLRPPPTARQRRGSPGLRHG